MSRFSVMRVIGMTQCRCWRHNGSDSGRWVEPCLDQQASFSDTVIVVELQNFGSYAPFGRHPFNSCAHEPEMVSLLFGSGIKKRCEFPCQRVMGANIWSFIAITTETGKRQIV